MIEVEEAQLVTWTRIMPAKGRAAIQALKDDVTDLIVVHVEATDEKNIA